MAVNFSIQWSKLSFEKKKLEKLIPIYEKFKAEWRNKFK